MSKVKPRVNSEPKLTRRELLRRARARKRRRARLKWAGAGLVALVVVGLIGWTQFRPRPGRAVLAQPGSHIRRDETYRRYSTDPPNSGPHRGSTIAPGFYTDVQPDENLVHNLEHGYVVLWYNCAAAGAGDCDQLQDDVRQVMNDAGLAPFAQHNKLIALPRAGLSFPLVAVSWGRMLEQATFDREGLLEFIQEFRGRAPEGGAS